MDKFQSDILLASFQTGRLEEFQKGEIILQAGEQPKGVYCIESGFIKVYSIGKDGGSKVHVIYKTGELFPLIWAVNGGLRNVYYEALEDVSLWRLPKADFLSKLEHDSEFCLAALKQATVSFQVYADRIDNLEYHEADLRVMYRLVYLAQRFGRQVSQGVMIDAPITHQLIADSINLSRETVSREIEQLEHRGLIVHHQHHLVIPNPAKLLEALSLEQYEL